MSNLWEKIINISELYNVSLIYFCIVYIVSIIPFYLGIFLIIHGSTREVSWKDVINLRLNKLKWNTEVRFGILIHLFGFLMPYGYILIFGKNFPLFFYIIISIIILFGLFSLGHKLIKSFLNTLKYVNDIVIFSREIINKDEPEKLWQIYNDSFSRLNKETPCRQSFHKEHFFEILKDRTVLKYSIVKRENNEIIGIGLVTNNLKNSPWISEEFFKNQFSEFFSRNLVYYFLGLAIYKKYRNKGYAIKLIEKVIDDLPKEAIMGFDHSQNINPLLYHFTKLVRQKKNIRRKCLDKQIYHVVYQK